MRTSALLAAGACCILLTSFAYAQELSPGKYSGSFSAAGAQGLQIRITLDIKSVENGTVQGSGERQANRPDGRRVSQGCVGAFPLTGTAKGGAVDLRAAEKYGPSGDCSFRLVGTVSGDKISGKIAQNDIELTK